MISRGTFHLPAQADPEPIPSLPTLDHSCAGKWNVPLEIIYDCEEPFIREVCSPEDDFSLDSAWEDALVEENAFYKDLFKSNRNDLNQRRKQKNKAPRIKRVYGSAHQLAREERKMDLIMDMVAAKKTDSPAVLQTKSYSYGTPAAPVPSYQPASSSYQPAPVSVPVYRAPPLPVKSQYEQDLENAIRISQQQTHESGLSFAQISDMANRELTPEDYELLLLLDSQIAKPTVSEEKLDSLTESKYDGTQDLSECTICMCPYDNGDDLKHLPCKHFFHNECVSTWLSKHSKTCPLCNAAVN